MPDTVPKANKAKNWPLHFFSTCHGSQQSIRHTVGVPAAWAARRRPTTMVLPEEDRKLWGKLSLRWRGRCRWQALEQVTYRHTRLLPALRGGCHVGEVLDDLLGVFCLPSSGLPTMGRNKGKQEGSAVIPLQGEPHPAGTTSTRKPSGPLTCREWTDPHDL